MRGRTIYEGEALGRALVSHEPIGFYGGVDPESGQVLEAGHPLEGQSVAGKVLVFPRGKGSTVGSYTLYRLRGNGVAPAAILNRECETVVAVGAIISEIPCVDQIEIEEIESGDLVRVCGSRVEIEERA